MRFRALFARIGARAPVDTAAAGMTTTPNANLVRKKQLAALLAVSVRTIDGWVAQRAIPFIAPSRRLHLFDPEQVRQVLTARFGVQPRSNAN